MSKPLKIIALIIAWTWIAVPLGWGVYQSVQKSLPLFQRAGGTDAPNCCSTTVS